MAKFKLLVLGFFALLGGCASIQVKPITPDEVVQMAKSNIPSDAIIQKLKQSGTVYQLSAAELVTLHNQGVPTPVLDYMQNTYLEAVRRDEAQRAFFYQPSPFWYGRPYYYPYYWRR
ncbi:MAG: hypothetical protein V4568_07265 [Pseudomonadota bacterium]